MIPAFDLPARRHRCAGCRFEWPRTQAHAGRRQFAHQSTEPLWVQP